MSMMALKTVMDRSSLKGARFLDMGQRRIDYLNAGHPAPFLWGVDQPLLKLESTGMILSPCLPTGRWKQASVPFRSGCRLFLYTDGVTEAPAEGGEFGERRLVELLARAPSEGTPLLDTILSNLKGLAGPGPLFLRHAGDRLVEQ